MDIRGCSKTNWFVLLLTQACLKIQQGNNIHGSGLALGVIRAVCLFCNVERASANPPAPDGRSEDLPVDEIVSDNLGLRQEKKKNPGKSDNKMSRTGL